MKKEEIYSLLCNMKETNKKLISELKTSCSVTDFAELVREENSVKIWTEAFQTALDNYEIINIPASDEPYYIDKSLVVPSNRHIEAREGAVIRQLSGVKVLMLRNSNVADGTHKPIESRNENYNISINGGIWEECRNESGIGKSGMIDENGSFYGVSACMLFNNMENLTLTNMTFVRAGCFAVQMGNVKNAVFENIKFVGCFADGLHINGNTENVFVVNLSGQVGDDVFALNMYDWQNSSVTFGPIKNVWCENIRLSEGSRYKALRILPGTYYYDDGSSVDCSLNNAVIKNVRGIKTIKMYFQTAAYKFETEEPEKGDAGTGDNIYFDDIVIDLDSPVDGLPEYLNSDPIKGSVAGFELGSNIGNLYFENIDVTLHRDKFPMSFFACVGPKSARSEAVEYFNPDMNSTIDKIELKNIRINGKAPDDIREFINEIKFEDIYRDGKSSGKGVIHKIVY